LHKKQKFALELEKDALYMVSMYGYFNHEATGNQDNKGTEFAEKDAFSSFGKLFLRLCQT
jgi:hypothetical protein